MSELQNITIRTVGELHRMLGLEKPKHPLFSVIRFEDFPKMEVEKDTRLITDFYQVTFKKENPCKIRYGQKLFDFDEGVVSCFAPRKVSFIDTDFEFATSGWQLSIHSDFIRNHPLGKKIKQYTFFDYATNEALILSDKEQQHLELTFQQIDHEYKLPIDIFSQDAVLSSVDVLLTYCNRYYNRQFITRQSAGNSGEILIKFNEILEGLLVTSAVEGLPTVHKIASLMNISPKYLSDCLKHLTEQTAQQLIHDKIIEMAKDILTTSETQVNEIAYKLGFEQPQSLNRLFKKKTQRQYHPLSSGNYLIKALRKYCLKILVF